MANEKRLTIDEAIARTARATRVRDAVRVAIDELGEKSGDVIAAGCLRHAASFALTREGFIVLAELAYAEAEAKRSGQ